MKAAKSPGSATASGRRASYRQGKRKVFVEPLADTFAVRCPAGTERTVSATLRSLGRVRAIESGRWLIVELPEAAQRAGALERLQQWVHEGRIEFVTPVLREAASQLQQILTDEITVRFKSPLSSERLRTLEAEYDVTVARRNEFVPNQLIVKVARPNGLRTLEVASQLDAADDVEFAAPNFISEFRR